MATGICWSGETGGLMSSLFSSMCLWPKLTFSGHSVLKLKPLFGSWQNKFTSSWYISQHNIALLSHQTKERSRKKQISRIWVLISSRSSSNVHLRISGFGLCLAIFWPHHWSFDFLQSEMFVELLLLNSLGVL